MNKYQARRAMCLWLPVIGTGSVLNLAAARYTTTLNGLNLVAITLICLGVLALAYDNKDKK